MGADEIERAERVVLGVLSKADADVTIGDILTQASELLHDPAAEVAARRALWNLVNAGLIKLTAARRFRRAVQAA